MLWLLVLAFKKGGGICEGSDYQKIRRSEDQKSRMQCGMSVCQARSSERASHLELMTLIYNYTTFKVFLRKIYQPINIYNPSFLSFLSLPPFSFQYSLRASPHKSFFCFCFCLCLKFNSKLYLHLNLLLPHGII